MPLTAADLTAPAGEIEPALFPGEDVTARLTAYLNDAYGKSDVTTAADPDAAARAWAYHRAYRAVYLRMSAKPASLSLGGDGGHGYTDEQIANFRRLAEDALKMYQNAVAQQRSGATGIGSGAVRNEFWP